VGVAGRLERALSEFRWLELLFNNDGFDGAVGPIDAIPVAEYDRPWTCSCAARA